MRRALVNSALGEAARGNFAVEATHGRPVAPLDTYAWHRQGFPGASSLPPFYLPRQWEI